MTTTNNSLSIIILTSVFPRHHYYAYMLSRSFPNVSTIVMEDKNEIKNSKSILENKYLQSWKRLEFDTFCSFEKKNMQRNDHIIKFVAAGEINSSETIEHLANLATGKEIVVVFGTSIIKETLINIFYGRMINLHLGLSPYYRGVATNLAPFFYGEPQYVGATVHHLDKGIDSGNILAQGRPIIDPDTDSVDSIGAKAIKVGVDLVLKVLEQYKNGKQPMGVAQDKSQGKLIMKNDLTDELFTGIKHNVKNGLILNYIPVPISIVELEK